jgi:hypothetical protein
VRLTWLAAHIAESQDAEAIIGAHLKDTLDRLNGLADIVDRDRYAGEPAIGGRRFATEDHGDGGEHLILERRCDRDEQATCPAAGLSDFNDDCSSHAARGGGRSRLSI